MILRWCIDFRQIQAMSMRVDLGFLLSCRLQQQNVEFIIIGLFDRLDRWPVLSCGNVLPTADIVCTFDLQQSAWQANGMLFKYQAELASPQLQGSCLGHRHALILEA